ncbi:hypothetical protein EG68_03955 [Paragonimus skrjabini miyazakii]|uniref:Uncharacterized protein n=1 Tax=Paragonimus skrjabini miyazakii TaxID=59628 RepID=A0A8S9YUM9_9TREM|nr:hypothetical protein EG68_03955 [Paragonimus skrjabini miyazakii]
MNTCDVIFKLSEQKDLHECPYRMTVAVNYTCLPVFSQDELICADSYVELTCNPLGFDTSLLILRAKLLYNLTTADIPHALLTKHQCANTDDTNRCINWDATRFYANRCNRRSVCTINPNMALQMFNQMKPQSELKKLSGQLNDDSFKVTGTLSEVENLFQCSKPNLLLEYTCAHRILLKPIAHSVAEEDGQKADRKPRKRERAQMGNSKLRSNLYEKTGHPHNSEKQEISSLTIPPIHEVTDPNEDQEKDAQNDATNKADSPDGIDSTTSLNSSRVMLISLVPSIVCLLLVLTLIVYIGHHRRLYHLRSKSNAADKAAMKDRLTHQGSQAGEHSVAMVKDCDFYVGELVHTSSYGNRLTTDSVYADRTKVLPHHWNPMTIPEPKLRSISPIGSACCSCQTNNCGSPCSRETRANFCSICAPDPYPIRSMTSSIGRVQVENIDHAVLSPGAVNQLAVDHGRAAGGQVKSAEKNGPLDYKRERQFIKSPYISVSTYLNKYNSGLLPVKTRFVEMEKDRLLDSSANDSKQYTDPRETMKPFINSTSPLITRSRTEPATTSMIEPKCDIYSAFGNQSVVKQLSGSMMHTTSSSVALDPSTRLKFSPPLFTSADCFVECLGPSLTASCFQNIPAAQQRSHPIPVVRYPHEFEGDLQEFADSGSDNQPNSSLSTVHTATNAHIMNSNRPDLLCPPVSSGEHHSNISERFEPKFRPTNTLDHKQTSKTLHTPDHNFSVPDRYPKMATGQISPTNRNLSTTGINRHPTTRETSSTGYNPNKLLRFQTANMEKPCSIHTENGSLSGSLNIPTSMCRSLQP